MSILFIIFNLFKTFIASVNEFLRYEGLTKWNWHITILTGHVKPAIYDSGPYTARYPEKVAI